MYKRDLARTLVSYAKLPVVTLLGPRQSGKTTLVRDVFKEHRYISFEDPSTRIFATEDPKRFLEANENEHGIIIDELQYVPSLLSYIQLAVDAKKRPGYFVLTGSQNFLANQAITQSLAGRVGILTLLPLSIGELKNNNLLPNGVDTAMVDGCYPRLYAESLLPSQLYPSYIQSYIERDVRQLINIGNLTTFQKFLQLCAGRVGQLLSINALADDCGISFPTARSWLSMLEASYIIFLLPPHFKKFRKSITKAHKIYFFDTAIVCSLLRINDSEILGIHPLRGNIFENYIMVDAYKQYCNLGMRSPLYFWRDQKGVHEVDCIVDTGLSLVPIEIKSGETITYNFFRELNYWNELAGILPEDSFLVYGGAETQERAQGTIIGWRDTDRLAQIIEERQRALLIKPKI
jgi:hypothetical protein